MYILTIEVQTNVFFTITADMRMSRDCCWPGWCDDNYESFTVEHQH